MTFDEGVACEFIDSIFYIIHLSMHKVEIAKGENAVFNGENDSFVKNALSKSCRPFQNLHFDMQQGGDFSP